MSEWWYPVGPILFFAMPTLLLVGWAVILHLERR